MKKRNCWTNKIQYKEEPIKTEYLEKEIHKEKILRCHECPKFQKRMQKYGYCELHKINISFNHISCEK